MTFRWFPAPATALSFGACGAGEIFSCSAARPGESGERRVALWRTQSPDHQNCHWICWRENLQETMLVYVFWSSNFWGVLVSKFSHPILFKLRKTPSNLRRKKLRWFPVKIFPTKPIHGPDQQWQLAMNLGKLWSFTNLKCLVYFFITGTTK